MGNIFSDTKVTNLSSTEDTFNFSIGTSNMTGIAVVAQNSIDAINTVTQLGALRTAIGGDKYFMIFNDSYSFSHSAISTAIQAPATAKIIIDSNNIPRLVSCGTTMSIIDATEKYTGTPILKLIIPTTLSSDATNPLVNSHIESSQFASYTGGNMNIDSTSGRPFADETKVLDSVTKIPKIILGNNGQTNILVADFLPNKFNRSLKSGESVYLVHTYQNGIFNWACCH